MTQYKENVTALVPSVGADGGQPLSKNDVQSIADNAAQFNASAEKAKKFTVSNSG